MNDNCQKRKLKKKIHPDTWSQIKGKYVSGKISITKIAQDHGISRKSIQRKAKKEEWVYGSSKDEVAKAIERATIETIVSHESDKGVTETQRFLSDSTYIRNIAMAIISGMAKELKVSGGRIRYEEANRLLQCQRVCESTMRTITGQYTAVRKALGLDRDADIEKHIKIKNGEKNQLVDPLDGITREEKIKAIKKLIS